MKPRKSSSRSSSRQNSDIENLVLSSLQKWYSLQGNPFGWDAHLSDKVFSKKMRNQRCGGFGTPEFTNKQDLIVYYVPFKEPEYSWLCVALPMFADGRYASSDHNNIWQEEPDIRYAIMITRVNSL